MKIRRYIIKILPVIYFLFIFFISCLTAVKSSSAADDRFILPTNSGFTGVLTVPNAYTIKNDRLRAGFSMEDPYRKVYITYGLLPGLEFNGLITEIIGAPGFSSSADSGYGYYKDKAFDFKYRLLKESKWFPALAIGINDPNGTRLYASQYIVASKEIYPFDFTLGFGNGRFGTKPLPSSGNGISAEMFSHPHGWLEQAMPFWAVQFFPYKKLGFEVAYDPTEYQNQTQDPAVSRDNFFEGKPVPSKYDFGVVYRPWKWLEITGSYQRGNTAALNIDMPFDVYKPFIDVYDELFADTPYQEGQTFRDKIRESMVFYGFSNIGIYINGSFLYVQAENNKFFSDRTAAYMIMRSLAEIDRGKIKKARLVIEDNYVPVLEASANLPLLKEVISTIPGYHNAGEFIKVKVETGIRTISVKTVDDRIFNYHISPSFRSFLNDPSGFFKYSLGAVAYGVLHPWTGGSVVAGVGAYPLNNISTNQAPLSIPVRSDNTYYLKRRLDLYNLMFQQTAGFPGNMYGKVSAGLLEYEYGGVNAQLAKVLANGHVILEIGGSYVKKRSVGDALGFGDVPDETPLSHYYTALFTTVFNFKNIGISLKGKFGRFLAGDYGGKFFLSKYMENGVEFTGFYSYTETTSVFPPSDTFNRHYHDIGLEVSIPLRIMDGFESKTTFNYSVSAWTRDVAQDIEQYLDLSDFLTRNIFVDKNR